MSQQELDLAYFRQRLETMRSSIEQEIAGVHDEAVNADLSDSYGAKNHPAEDATEVFTRERSLAIEGELQRELRRVDHALKRLEDGKYGVCEIGGEIIPAERLEARPVATLCIRHQREQDAQAPNTPDLQV